MSTYLRYCDDCGNIVEPGRRLCDKCKHKKYGQARNKRQ